MSESQKIDFFDIQKPNLVPPKGVSDGFFRDIVTAAYDFFVANGRRGSVEELMRQAGKSDHTKARVSKVMASDAFKYAIRMRGIPTEDQHGLTAEQSYLLAILTDPSDKRTLHSKLRAVGVPYARYRAWLKQPLFNQYLNNLAEGMLRDHQGDVLTQLVGKATSGDMRAIEFYLEVTGRHDPKRQSEIEVTAVLGKVVEIITKHVRDPRTLQAIASEMSMLGLAGRAQTVQAMPLIEQDQGPTEPVPALPSVTPKTVYFDFEKD